MSERCEFMLEIRLAACKPARRTGSPEGAALFCGWPDFPRNELHQSVNAATKFSWLRFFRARRQD